METQTPAQTTTETKYSKEHIEKNVTNLEKSLDFNNITTLRGTQAAEYARARDEAIAAGKDVNEIHEAGLAAVRASSIEYVADAIVEGDLDADVAQQLDALVDKYSVTNMSDDLWYNDQQDAAGNVTSKKGINLIQTDLTLLTSSIEAKEADANPRLSELREKMAKLSAKRQGSFFGKSKKYQEAEQEYNSEVVAAGKDALKNVLEDPTISDTDKNAKVLEYIFAEQAELRTLSLQKLENSPISKIIKAVSGGPTWKKYAIVGGLVASGVALGAVGGVVAGATGVGVAAGVMFGAKVAKKFSDKEFKNGRGVGQLTDGDKARITTDSAGHTTNYFEVAQSHLNDQLEKDTTKEQKKHSRSAIFAVGSVALASGLGAVGGYFAGRAIEAGINAVQENPMYQAGAKFVGDVFENNKDMFDKVPSAGASDGPSTEAGQTYSDARDLANGERGNGYTFSDAREPGYQDGVEGPGQVVVDTPTTETTISTAPGASGPETQYSFPPETGNFETLNGNFAVQYGEGGIHMFERLGLTEAQWYEVADELVEKTSGEFKDVGNDVWIMHTGRLSDEAIDVIKTRFSI